VNSLKLVPNEPHVLNAGDKVEIGKPSDEEEWDHLQLCDRFVYIVKVSYFTLVLFDPKRALIALTFFQKFVCGSSDFCNMQQQTMRTVQKRTCLLPRGFA